MSDNDAQFVAYVAGFFDGEGSVSIKRRVAGGYVRHELEVRFSQSDRRVLDLIHDVYGGRVVALKNYQPTKHRDKFNLVIGGKRAGSLLGRLHPHLRVKHEQARVGLLFSGTIGAPYVQANLAKRDALREEILRLNRRGPR